MSSIKFGSNNISNLKLGTNQVSAVYIGSTNIFTYGNYYNLRKYDCPNCSTVIDNLVGFATSSLVVGDYYKIPNAIEVYEVLSSTSAGSYSVLMNGMIHPGGSNCTTACEY